MAEIIPAIIAKDFQDLKNKIKIVEPYVQTVQLDIMDGIFVSNETWRAPDELVNLETKLFLEAHLMVTEPEKVFEQWAASPVQRIIVHWEALENFKSQILNFAQHTYERNKEFGIALNPETPLEVLDHFINKVDLVLLMSVNPGFAGQPFQESVIPRIVSLRQKYPDVKIGVDGGVNLSNAKKLALAGAEFLAVGSFIYAAGNPEQVIAQLNETLK
jgi:ribulose-phosphate 3-epimerase